MIQSELENLVTTENAGKQNRELILRLIRRENSTFLIDQIDVCEFY